MKKLLAAATLSMLVGAGLLPASVEARPAEDPAGLWVQRSLSIEGDYLPLVGDFNGDASDDILWYPPTGGSAPLWIGREGRRDAAAFKFVLPTINKQYQPFVGDFTGDDLDDIFWFAPGAASDFIWVGARGAEASFGIQGVKATSTGTPIVLHDRNPGGKDDILWYTPGPGADELWVEADSKGNPDERIPLRIDGRYRPIVGDWNGDGREEPFWYASGPAADYRWISQPDGSYASWPTPVNGVFTPVVLSPGLAAGTDRFDDILWFGAGSTGSRLWRNIDGHFAKLPANNPYGGAGSGVRIPAPAVQLTDAVLYGPSVDNLGYASAAGFFKLADHLLPVGSQQPLVGDFDHDGFSDIVWYGRRSVPDAIWYGNAT